MIFSMDIDEIIGIDCIELEPFYDRVSMLALGNKSGYTFPDDLETLYRKHFMDSGNSKLSIKYMNLRKEIIENPVLVCLVLFGLNRKSYVIESYTKNNRYFVKLTMSSISRILIREYFGKDEFHRLCEDCLNMIAEKRRIASS